MVVRLRFDDFTRVSRSHTLVRATANTETTLTAARALIGTAWPLIEQRGLTLVGIAVGNLQTDAAAQQELPFDGHSNAALDMALDDVRRRFGWAAVTRAVLLGRDQADSPPFLDE